MIRRKLGLWEPDPVLDANANQHTVMVRFGNDALDRWAMCPSVISPGVIAKYILFVDWPKNIMTRQRDAQKRAIEAQKKAQRSSPRISKA